MKTEQAPSPPPSRPAAPLRSRAAAGPTVAPSLAFAGTLTPALGPFVEALEAALGAHGFEAAAEATGADLVVNLVDPAAPRPFRRKSRGTFVAALTSLPEEPADGLRETYPLLVRALANIVLCYLPGPGVSFTTMERGHYLVSETTTARSPSSSPSGWYRSRGQGS